MLWDLKQNLLTDLTGYQRKYGITSHHKLDTMCDIISVQLVLTIAVGSWLGLCSYSLMLFSHSVSLWQAIYFGKSCLIPKDTAIFLKFIGFIKKNTSLSCGSISLL